MKIGDLVGLKSGGTIMTVLFVNGAHARCGWMTSCGEDRQAVYPLAALEPREKDDDGKISIDVVDYACR
jgi:uncharacterized protein YodC (DUF2158 family)